MEPVTADELELVTGGATWTINLSCPAGYQLNSYVSGSSRCYTCRRTGSTGSGSSGSGTGSNIGSGIGSAIGGAVGGPLGAGIGGALGGAIGGLFD
jgi:hypothetical protein